MSRASCRRGRSVANFDTLIARLIDHVPCGARGPHSDSPYCHSDELCYICSLRREAAQAIADFNKVDLPPLPPRKRPSVDVYLEKYYDELEKFESSFEKRTG